MTQFDTLLYQKQANLITALRQQVDHLSRTLANQDRAGTFYLAMMLAIQDDIMLQDEWRRFIAILRLANPDLPGLTKAEHEFS